MRWRNERLSFHFFTLVARQKFGTFHLRNASLSQSNVGQEFTRCEWFSWSFQANQFGSIFRRVSSRQLHHVVLVHIGFPLLVCLLDDDLLYNFHAWVSSGPTCWVISFFDKIDTAMTIMICASVESIEVQERHPKCSSAVLKEKDREGNSPGWARQRSRFNGHVADNAGGCSAVENAIILYAA